MSGPTLLVMAAGIGSRYGGLKQMEPIGPGGESMVDYAVYDARRAGFSRVVFLIRKDIEEAFRERVGRAVERHIDTVYAFQSLDALPAVFTVPVGRQKPWGTGHAVLCCREVVHTPFVALNADDFYGATAYQALADHLHTAQDHDGHYDYCMVGYSLYNTLSDYGHVARGVCEVTPDGYLADVRERTRIQRVGDVIQYSDGEAPPIPLSGDSVVSLNIWGFTQSIFDELATRFEAFLRQDPAKLIRTEFYVPEVVGALVREGLARVKVLPTTERWLGVTYREDRPLVQATIAEWVQQGKYPPKLWE